MTRRDYVGSILTPNIHKDKSKKVEHKDSKKLIRNNLGCSIIR